MSSFNPRRFVNPDTLSRVSASNLLHLLRSTASAYFATPVAPGGPPRLDLSKPLDFHELTRVLLTADDASYPDDLADALYHIATFSEEDAITELLDAFGPLRLNLAALGSEPSPADVALRAWILDAPLVERTLGERQLFRSKSWVHHIGETNPASPIGIPAAATLAALEKSLKDWFLKNRGSDFVRILPYAKGDETWFLVHHAKAAERRSIIKNGQQTSSVDRPDRYDLVVYDPSYDELSLNTENDKEREVYRQEFGRHLFGKLDYFAGSGKYTLEPLVTKGASALLPNGIPGIDKITLKEAHYAQGPEIVVRKAPDLFAVLAKRQPPESTLRQAPFRVSFSVKLSAVKRPRTVVIHKGNRAKYQHDGERDLIEEWLDSQGFIKVR
jgi:hypothetical protein